MTEDDNPQKPQIGREDIKMVVDQIQKTYDSHASLSEEERLSNDMRTSLTMFMNKVYTWTHEKSPKKASEETLSLLFEESFNKLSGIYPDPKQREVLSSIVESETARLEDKEDNVVKLTIKLLKDNFRKVFGEES